MKQRRTDRASRCACGRNRLTNGAAGRSVDAIPSFLLSIGDRWIQSCHVTRPNRCRCRPAVRRPRPNPFAAPGLLVLSVGDLLDARNVPRASVLTAECRRDGNRPLPDKRAGLVCEASAGRSPSAGCRPGPGTADPKAVPLSDHWSGRQCPCSSGNGSSPTRLAGMSFPARCTCPTVGWSRRVSSRQRLKSRCRRRPPDQHK